MDVSERKIFVRFGFPRPPDRSLKFVDGVSEWFDAGDEMVRGAIDLSVLSTPQGPVRIGEVRVDGDERVDGNLQRVVECGEDCEFGIAREMVWCGRRVGSHRPFRPRAMRRGHSFSGGAKVSR